MERNAGNDVVFVGGGPANLSGAASGKLVRRHNEVAAKGNSAEAGEIEIGVIEKGASVGLTSFRSSDGSAGSRIDSRLHRTRRTS